MMRSDIRRQTHRAEFVVVAAVQFALDRQPQRRTLAQAGHAWREPLAVGNPAAAPAQKGEAKKGKDSF